LMHPALENWRTTSDGAVYRVLSLLSKILDFSTDADSFLCNASIFKFMTSKKSNQPQLCFFKTWLVEFSLRGNGSSLLHNHAFAILMTANSWLRNSSDKLRLLKICSAAVPALAATVIDFGPAMGNEFAGFKTMWDCLLCYRDSPQDLIELLSYMVELACHSRATMGILAPFINTDILLDLFDYVDPNINPLVMRLILPFHSSLSTLHMFCYTRHHH
jgi:hypothetical protein